MNFALFGGFGKRPLPPGWTRETAVAILGGGQFDLTSSPPGPQARLTAVSLLGGVEITVPPGSRVRMSGLSLLGGREVEVNPGEGPEFRLHAVAILGGVTVKEAPEAVTSTD